VRNLGVETQTNTSITLRWDVPEGPDAMNLTYWVQWFRDGDRNEIQHTTNTSITVDGLNPGSSYEFSVWAEREGANSSKETLNAATGKSNHCCVLSFFSFFLFLFLFLSFLFLPSFLSFFF
jgi:receptor-type tyrosine-protein phosphatase H